MAKMVGDFSEISNLVDDRSPITPTVVQPLDHMEPLKNLGPDIVGPTIVNYLTA